eukprot:GEMP01069545.1.p1 GENE.GEMP01069545.1~~GEMP01069545.1.p1  ORF type:complete len:314 (+),score=31.73 GEMP01069545.1:208-1149(+)
MFSYLSLSLPLLTLRWVILIEPVLGTFSIVGVDTRTKEVGSAGATCITTNGFQLNMMTAVIPNNGAINVQSRHDKSAKAQAMQLFRNGETAASVMSKLPRKTQQSFSNIFQTVDQHQYLAVDINGGSTTHSGPMIFPSGESVEGNVNSRFFFAIAGNTLNGTLGVTQRMKTAFENAPGSASLADRLMAALESGNIAGADRRCQEFGQSANTAYLKMARPTDKEDQLWVDLRVLSINKDPIFALSTLYKQWKQKNAGRTVTIICIIVAVFMLAGVCIGIFVFIYKTVTMNGMFEKSVLDKTRYGAGAGTSRIRR